MGLGSEMKNLSEELLASFKQRIRENEELVSDVQNTLDGFRKDHQEMTAIINANAIALRKGLASGEKERLNSYNELMSGIHHTIASIKKEVVEIQTSTFSMINEFVASRMQMATELNKFFAEGRADRTQDEKTRMEEFNALMNDINVDIKSINDEVLAIFKEANDMLENFEKEHLEMSAELRSELGKNLAERVEYTNKLLNGFQKRLSEISKENQKMAQKLRKDLASGEATRLGDYKGLMSNIHQAIKGIQKEVKDIKKATTGMIGDLSHDRSQGSAEWNKMQDAIAQLRKTGVVKSTKETFGKAEKKKEAIKESPIEVVKVISSEPIKETLIETVKDVPAEPIKEVQVKEAKEITVDVQPKVNSKPTVPMTLDEKVLDYINAHPTGVKVSEMEEPLGETRMKLGFTAKALLDQGKVQKMDNVYFPLK